MNIYKCSTYAKFRGEMTFVVLCAKKTKSVIDLVAVAAVLAILVAVVRGEVDKRRWLPQVGGQRLGRCLHHSCMSRLLWPHILGHGRGRRVLRRAWQRRRPRPRLPYQRWVPGRCRRLQHDAALSGMATSPAADMASCTPGPSH